MSVSTQPIPAMPPQPAARANAHFGHMAVKPHLLRYVEYREYLLPGQPLIVPGHTPIRIALDLCLTSKKTFLGCAGMEPLDPATFTEKLQYQVTGRRYQQGAFFVTPDMERNFNTFLHLSMHEDLARRVFAGIVARRDEKDIIWEFMSATRIGEVFEFDALKRANFRFRSNLGFERGRGNVRPAEGSERFLRN